MFKCTNCGVSLIYVPYTIGDDVYCADCINGVNKKDGK